MGECTSDERAVVDRQRVKSSHMLQYGTRIVVDARTVRENEHAKCALYEPKMPNRDAVCCVIQRERIVLF